MVAADAGHAGRRVVYVSGAPGAGKSTLAGPLAARLRFALLAKDLIKETLHDGLGAPASDLQWSRRLGGAAMELLWALAAQAADVVVEANFRPNSEYERARIAALAGNGGRLVEVYCHCPLDVAMARYAERASACHPVHVVTSLTPEFMADFDRPVGLGDLIDVDTTAPVDVAAVAQAILDRLASAPIPTERSAPRR
ncbi:MAG TPA: AAA family ATPase [Streptosporangiaceae bacterium]|nr:AAA family ATPase [Streptosporangiaceae bacterium]